MKDVWNLDVIYRGFEDPAFAADMQALEETVKGFGAFAASVEKLDTLEGLREGIAWEEKLTELGEPLTVLPEDTAYVRLIRFGGNAVSGMRTAMALFKAQGKKNLILAHRCIITFALKCICNPILLCQNICTKVATSLCHFHFQKTSLFQKLCTIVFKIMTFQFIHFTIWLSSATLCQK